MTAMVPKPFKYIVAIVLALALVPPALIARARAKTSEKPRIHYIQDMDNMRRIGAQQASPAVDGVPLFTDGRGMRPNVPGTIARGELLEDTHYHQGVTGSGWATSFPSQVNVDRALVERGRTRFNIYCTPCHGYAGYGDGVIHQRAMQLLQVPTMNNGTAWVAPKSVHEPDIAAQPIGQTFNTITNGVRTMAGYGAQVPVEDRWAIVAYVKALQRSQNAPRQDVPNPDGLPAFSTNLDEEGES